MGTNIRPKISTKKIYYLDKHRYYELKHFCLQYPEWKRELCSLDGFSRHCSVLNSIDRDGTISDPTATKAEERLYFSNRIRIVENAANEAAGDIIGKLLLRSVTEDISYDHLNALERIPCCKDIWYTLYRRFFWILDKTRR